MLENLGLIQNITSEKSQSPQLTADSADKAEFNAHLDKASKQAAEAPAKRSQAENSEPVEAKRIGNSKPAGRAKDMKEFLGELEKECGITPQEWVAALSELSTAQLASPPEQALPQALESFDLTETQEAAARELISRLLGANTSDNLKSKFTLDSSGLVQAETDSGIDENPADNSMLGSMVAAMQVPPPQIAQIENLAAETAMDSEGASDLMAQATALTRPEMAAPAGAEHGPASGQTLSSQNILDASEFESGLSEKNVLARDLSDADFENLKTSVENEQTKKTSDNAGDGKLILPKELSDDNVMPAEISEMLNGLKETSEAKPKTNPTEVEKSAVNFGQIAATGDGQAQNSAEDMNQEGSDKAESDSILQDGKTPRSEKFETSAFDANLAAQLNPSVGRSDGPGSAVESQAVPVELNNLGEMVQSARTLIREGGGEMKLKLNPDGLGEVELKVVLDQGRVQLEMIASTQEGKKALETGLSELRASLSAHNLNLDSVKVENTQEASRQFNDEAGRQLGQQASQSFTHQQSSRNPYRQSGEQGLATGVSGGNLPGSAGLNPASQSRGPSSRRLDVVA